MNEVFYNGTFYPVNGPALPVSNRGFHYGDGFFETIRLIDGKPVFLDHHFSRVLETMEAYKIERPIDFTLQKLEKEIIALSERNQIEKGGRVRVTFCLKSAGYYLPIGNELEYIIEANSLEHNRFTLNEQGRNVDLCVEFKKDLNRLAVYKRIECQVYIQAALFAHEKGLDDALVQNYKGSIIEATSSNVFLVSNGVLYTSGLDEGPVAGTMRMNIINLALENGIKVYECTLTPQNLLAADELFLTNAIHGVQWVGSYRTKRYFNDMSVRFCRLLNAKLGI
ncbi:MAG: aminotransferase class IV [Flavobacteriales bacterium]|nr:aminotransferase class IV [Flavobacteriales bacterium]